MSMERNGLIKCRGISELLRFSSSCLRMVATSWGECPLGALLVTDTELTIAKLVRKLKCVMGCAVSMIWPRWSLISSSDAFGMYVQKHPDSVELTVEHNPFISARNCLDSLNLFSFLTNRHLTFVPVKGSIWVASVMATCHPCWPWEAESGTGGKFDLKLGPTTNRIWP